ncbi:MAG: hypothetical protein ACOCV3_02385 [Halanaerobiales bacterium]
MVIDLIKKKFNRLFLPVLVISLILGLLFFYNNHLQAADKDEININQDLSISIGKFMGDADLYSEYNDDSIPSLSPSIEYDTEASGSLSTAEDLQMEFLLSAEGDEDEFLDLLYKNYGFKMGAQDYRIPIHGFNYQKTMDGMKAYYHDKEKGINVEAFNAQKKSNYTEVELKGDNSPGPYFLGHKDILEESETVYLDGVKQNRGSGPEDENKDYYMDYEGGFLYFNKVISDHQKIKVTYEYEFGEEEYGGNLRGGDFSYDLSDKVLIEGYYLNDNLPLDEESVFAEAGYDNQSAGLSVVTTGNNYQFKNTLMFSDLKEELSQTFSYGEKLIVSPENQDKEFELEYSPVLYESETLRTEDGEKLERNLDYRVQYSDGRVIFNTEFKETKIIEVSYEYIDNNSDTREKKKRGIKSSNTVSYDNEIFKNDTDLDYYYNDFTDFKWQREPLINYDVNTENEYMINKNWRALLDLDMTDGDQFREYETDIGVKYSADKLDTSIKYNRVFEDEEDKELKLDNNLITDLNYKFPHIDFSSTFYNQLMENSISLDQYEMSFLGTEGDFGYEGEYRHGFSNYEEELGLKIAHSYQWSNLNFSNELDNTFYYPDSFKDQPKRITVFSNNARYTGDKYYVNNKAGYRESSDVESEVYETDLNLEVNYELNKDIFINNQLEYNYLTGSKDIKDNINNLFVYSHQFTDIFNLTTQVGTEYNESGEEDDISYFYEYYYNFNLNFDQNMYSLNFDIFEKNAESIYQNEREKDIEQKISGEIEYDFDYLKLLSGLSFTRYDYQLMESQFKLKPVREIGEELEIWGEYRLDLMHEKWWDERKYRAHQLFFGLSYNL